MPISFYDDNMFLLETKNTFYSFTMNNNLFPVHLFYGNKKKGLTESIFEPINEFSPFYEKYGLDYSPSLLPSEFPFFGSGDFRASALKLRNMGNGSDTTLFTYQSARICKGRVTIPNLPFAAEDKNTETLIIDLIDNANQCKLKLYYTVFADCDVITRFFSLKNNGNNDVRIEKCMSLALDIPTTQLDVISFPGKWSKERIYQRNSVIKGSQSIFSRRGASSHFYNPFFMICDNGATEEKGNAYGFNLVYSGSFLNEIETDHNGFTRILSGLGSESFNYLLKPGEEFFSPEAVMTFSDAGIGTVSNNMHKFIKKHILPKKIYEQRPVVLNTWEGFGFNIDEKLMVKCAEVAAEIGIDLLVMDDGWFGDCRMDETTGMGDWHPCETKFPNGLENLVNSVRKCGVKFGIWFEPEMVGANSNIFKLHPDWILKAPDREQLLGRYEYVIDLANPEVIKHLKKVFTDVLSELDIGYIKWDMNRNMTNVYSPYLPPERQGEVQFRYMQGLYDLLGWFNEKFPHIMIESCSGGGGRYDLGMMKYSTQIWTSDNTDPIDRTFIQYGSSFGYPTCVMSCHVTNHNNSAENEKILNYGFNVAINGVLGYELDILNLSQSIKQNIAKQIKEYRNYENLIINGEFHRIHNPDDDGKYSFYFVNSDASEILLIYLQNNDNPKKKNNKLCISKANLKDDYYECISEQTFTGKQLVKGISVTSSETGYSSKLFYFKKVK